MAVPSPSDGVPWTDECAASASSPRLTTAEESDIATDTDSNVAATYAYTYAYTDTCNYYTYDSIAVPPHESLLVHLARLISSALPHRAGVIRTPPLPSFPTCWRDAMATSRQYQVPSTPHVISPSPTPSEAGSAKDGYFGPTTRSSARKKQQQQQQQRLTSPPSIDEDSSNSDPDQRARARSRDAAVKGGLGRRKLSGLTSRRPPSASTSLAKATHGTANAHLSPAAANKNYWREMSRSPSPLGLIPIHQKWRSFVRTHALCGTTTTR